MLWLDGTSLKWRVKPGYIILLFDESRKRKRFSIFNVYLWKKAICNLLYFTYIWAPWLAAVLKYLRVAKKKSVSSE